MSFSELKDRVPPNHFEAEQSVLGAVLLDREALHKAQSIVKADDFYKTAHQKIYQAIINLNERSEAIDLITLTDELNATNELDLIGGPAYISKLTSVVPSSANVEYYAKIVKDCSMRRRLISIAGKMGASSYEPSVDSRSVIEEAEKGLFEVSDNHGNLDFKRVRDLVSPAISSIEEIYKRKGELSGIPTGFEELDSMTAGFQDSEMIIIGARPSIGKTAFALSMAAHMAFHATKPIPVGFFSLEMAANQIMHRLISMEAKIDAKRIRTGLLQMQDFKSITDAAGIIYEAPFWIADTPNMRLLDLRAQARRMRMQYGVRIIFIDYISLISPERPEIPRHEQMADISRSLKALARELKIPIVVLSQVKRETEGKSPSLSDLRESGSIEQDADVVMFLHRERMPEKKGSDGRGSATIPTEVILAKQRNGPIGVVEVGFHSEYAQFVSLTKDRQ